MTAGYANDSPEVIKIKSNLMGFRYLVCRALEDCLIEAIEDYGYREPCRETSADVSFKVPTIKKLNLGGVPVVLPAAVPPPPELPFVQLEVPTSGQHDIELHHVEEPTAEKQGVEEPNTAGSESTISNSPSSIGIPTSDGEGRHDIKLHDGEEPTAEERGVEVEEPNTAGFESTISNSLGSIGIPTIAEDEYEEDELSFHEQFDLHEGLVSADIYKKVGKLSSLLNLMHKKRQLAYGERLFEAGFIGFTWSSKMKKEFTLVQTPRRKKTFTKYPKADGSGCSH